MSSRPVSKGLFVDIGGHNFSFSGAVTMQAILYYKTYSNDELKLKIIVSNSHSISFHLTMLTKCKVNGIWWVNLLVTGVRSWLELTIYTGPLISCIPPWSWLQVGFT